MGLAWPAVDRTWNTCDWVGPDFADCWADIGQICVDLCSLRTGFGRSLPGFRRCRPQFDQVWGHHASGPPEGRNGDGSGRRIDQHCVDIDAHKQRRSRSWRRGSELDAGAATIQRSGVRFDPMPAGLGQTTHACARSWPDQVQASFDESPAGFEQAWDSFDHNWTVRTTCGLTETELRLPAPKFELVKASLGFVRPNQNGPNQMSLCFGPSSGGDCHMLAGFGQVWAS